MRDYGLCTCIFYCLQIQSLFFFNSYFYYNGHDGITHRNHQDLLAGDIGRESPYPDYFPIYFYFLDNPAFYSVN